MSLVVPALLAGLVVAVAVLLARYMRAHLHFRKLELAIPGPPTLPVLGNTLEFLGATSDNVMKLLLRMVNKRRGMTRFSILNNLFVVLNEPTEIDQMLRSKEFNDKSTFFYSLLHLVAKNGLVQLGGDEWRVHRRVLQPGFNKQVLDRFVDIFHDEAAVFAQRVPVNKDFDVMDDLRRALIRTFIRTSIAEDPGPKLEEDLMVLIKFADAFLRSINNRSFNPLLWSEAVYNMTPTGRVLGEMKVFIDGVTKGFLDMKRAAMSRTRGTDFIQERKTLLDILSEQDESGGYQMPDSDIMDEIKTFFGASVETTVSSLSWMLKVLSLRPRIQERVHAEICEVLGEQQFVTSGELPRLKYTECFVKESMRMFPAIPFTGRQVYKETELCGHTIPADSTIIINIFAAHHDPQHWPEPHRFDPDRFLPENSKGRHQCAYMPFSHGPRNCIGGQYAMMNMKSFLATVLKAHRIDPVDDGHGDLQSLQDNMTFDLTSRLVGGLRVKFTPRSVVAA